MSEPGSRTVRTRGRTTAGVACLAVGIAAFLSGYGGVDISVVRYVTFVAGGGLIVAGLLLLSMRALAVAIIAFVAAVAFEGPIPASGAQALRLLDDARVPRYAAAGTGFLGPTRDFPVRVFVGPPEAIGPFMVEPPARFSRDPTTYSSEVGPYRSAVAAGPTKILEHEGYTRIASWRGPRVQGRICTLELEVADGHSVSEALAGLSAGLRSRLEGKAVVRLLASCSSQAVPALGASPSPGATPTPGSTPSSRPTLTQRNGPR